MSLETDSIFKDENGNIIKLDKTIFDEKLKGRRIVVEEHWFPPKRDDLGLKGTHWFCGYVEVKPTDKAYKFAKNLEDYYSLVNMIFPSAIGEIDFADSLDWLGDDETLFVGFSTLHPFCNLTKNEVINATKLMVISLMQYERSENDAK
ncbi:hypothetical protein [Lactobacillus sp. LL6]|uniref:hypothetical protein n=1 Tax=Lactobacillus sp. LL6 TaxID=2596827 RepID=UPI00118489CF|nr:hypothetical protein [Lactobacillus sp. LL6]TSO25315.1 hypothetical protein FOD82_08740 [Lactobacillus sp. LL6]